MQSMKLKDENWFFRSAAALLVVTALAKLYSAGGSARILRIRDALLHIGYRPLMLLAALLEIAIAVFLLRSRSELKWSLVLLWLSANFIIYHFGNYLIGVHLCPCLGQLADRLPLPRGLTDVALQVLLLYWLLVGVQSVWRLWGRERWGRLTGSGHRAPGVSVAVR